MALGASVATVLVTVSATPASAQTEFHRYEGSYWKLGFADGNFLRVNDRGLVEIGPAQSWNKHDGLWVFRQLWIDGGRSNKWIAMYIGKSADDPNRYDFTKPETWKCLAIDSRGGYLLQRCSYSGAQQFYLELPPLGENGPVHLSWAGGGGQTFWRSYFV